MKTVRKAFILAILAMFVASVAVIPMSIRAATAVNQGPGTVAAGKLIEIVEKALSRAKAIIAASASANITVPQAANDNIAQATAALDKAKSSLTAGDVRGSMAESLEAMRYLRQGLTLVVLPPEEKKEAQDAVKIDGLSKMINRTKHFIARLQNMTSVMTQRLSALNQQGMNVTNAQTMLASANAELVNASNHVAQAELLLNHGNYTAAAKEHGMAQSTAAKALHDIREAAQPEKHERIREFVDRFDHRLSGFEEKLNKLADKIPAEALQRIRDHIAEARARLNATRADIGHADFEKAIDKLEDTLGRLDEATERLEEQKPAIGERLDKAIDVLQMNLEKIEARVHAAEKGRLAEKLADVKEKLAELKEKLAEIKQDMKSDHADEASEKISQLQVKIDELAAKLESIIQRG